MDWPIDDALYSRFNTWKLKCDNILKVKLGSLPDARKSKTLLQWSGCFRLGAYTQGKSLQTLCGQDGRSSASHKLMNRVHDMTCSSHSDKLDPVRMSGTIKCRSHWLYVVDNRRPHASCLETYFCLVCKTKSFLPRVCQRLVFNGLQPGSGIWPKSWKAAGLLPST